MPSLWFTSHSMFVLVLWVWIITNILNIFNFSSCFVFLGLGIRFHGYLHYIFSQFMLNAQITLQYEVPWYQNKVFFAK